MFEEKFSCQNKNLTIRGLMMVKEETDERLPAVILSHGFTSDMKRMREYGEMIASFGYRAFLFDFCGGGFHTISDGSFEEDMTPLTEKSDLLCVFDYVRNRNDVDEDRIVLLGNSQGGFVSALVGALLDTKVCGLVLNYPAFCIPDDARNGSMQVIRFDPKNIPDYVGVSPMRVSGEYPKSILNMDYTKEIVGYHGPVLITHGTADHIVPVAYAQQATQTYKENGNDVTLLLLEGSDHGYDGEAFVQAGQSIHTFLEKVFA